MATVKKIPTRRCTGCGEHFPKPTLIRVVRSPEGVISLDRTGKAAGRGAYLCKSAECLRRAQKSRRIEQALEVAIPPEVYASMEGELARE